MQSKVFVYVSLFTPIYLFSPANLKYTYVFTEDAKPGPFGRIENPRSQSIFHIQQYQPFVAVGLRTGILKLKKRLTSLHQYRYGIRRLSLTISVQTRSIYYSRYKPRYTVKVILIIFPLYFGDTSLQNSGKKLRAGVVQRNNFFASSGPTASSFLRILRQIPSGVDPEGFNYALSSITTEKGIGKAVQAIVRNSISNSGKFLGK